MAEVIAAVSTGLVVSAIGILRLSGDGCAQVAGKVFQCKSGRPLEEAPNRKLIMGQLHDKEGRLLDSCCAIYTRGPGSYTGEDTVEFHCHGSPAVLAAGLEALYSAGARPARQGEFTKRAFMNGRMDLSSAEAVIDLIEAESADAAANAAGQVTGALSRQLRPIYDRLADLCSHFHAVLDYPDEDIDDFRMEQYSGAIRADAKRLYKLVDSYGQGQILKNGVRAAIVGKPNVGKSSLLNALVGYQRVIVTEIAGTTRDTVEETVRLGGIKLRLTDTAGIHETEDRIEAMGVERSKAAIKEADVVLFLCDGSQKLDAEDMDALEECCFCDRAIGLINKCDLHQVVEPSDLPFDNVIPISAKTGDGLEQLADVLEYMFQNQLPCDGSILTNPRQYDAISRAYVALLRALEALMLGYTPDAVLTDVEQAMEAIGEVTGATVRQDITDRIFQRFCVGK